MFPPIVIFLVLTSIALTLPFSTEVHNTIPTTSLISIPSASSTVKPSSSFQNVDVTSTYRSVPATSAAATTSTPTSYHLPTQSGWSPSDIGTIVFGCIASILGALALWLTTWLGHRLAERQAENCTFSLISRQLASLIMSPLNEDFPSVAESGIVVQDGNIALEDITNAPDTEEGSTATLH